MKHWIRRHLLSAAGNLFGIVPLRMALVAISLSLTGQQPAHAQPDTGGPAPGPGANPTGVPVDGGASLLLAAGVGLGLKKLRQRRAQRP
ncbi:PID-CTERM protein-sorting domain-containing protein [Hymenobacter daeguensis]